MNTPAILDYLRRLAANNNREWFNDNKSEYKACLAEFETFVQAWIDHMTTLDPTLQVLTPKDCIWRIYRDTRFSHDKTPYKDHFGAFIARHGGKKSQWAGWYLHLQPGACMFASGMWCPEPDVLKRVRTALYDNWDEMEELMQAPLFRKYFQDFDYDYTLKKVPAGFPADAPHAEWLKLKTYSLSCSISDNDTATKDFMERLMEMCEAAKPINDFLNYTFEEDL